MSNRKHFEYNICILFTVLWLYFHFFFVYYCFGVAIFDSSFWLFAFFLSFLSFAFLAFVLFAFVLIGFPFLACFLFFGILTCNLEGPVVIFQNKLDFEVRNRKKALKTNCLRRSTHRTFKCHLKNMILP